MVVWGRADLARDARGEVVVDEMAEAADEMALDAILR